MNRMIIKGFVITKIDGIVALALSSVNVNSNELVIKRWGKREELMQDALESLRKAKTVLSGIHKRDTRIITGDDAARELASVGLRNNRMIWAGLLVGSPPVRRVRRAAVLYPDEWLVLEEIAGDLGAIATRGVTAGKPSWAALLRGIANGTYKVAVSE